MNLQTFSFENQQVRTIEIENEPWFVANDVTTILGLSNTTVALQRLDEDERAKYNLGRQGMTNIVNEYGLYNLVLASRKPEAKQFKRWITHEVLPTIRKHGAYLTDKKAYDITHNPNSLADLLLQAGEQLKQKELIIKEMQPKALFADAVTASHTSILVGDLAKILKQNGVDIGAKRLFAWLRENGYLIKRKGAEWNSPTQKSMDLGLFETKETVIQRPDGGVDVKKTPKVTGKGQVYFVNKFKTAM
ncbi:hypothetical protein EB06_01201 [Enterococcus cecorum]|uniref:phage antirepressor n=1 Tax=Enterococcus cecorum TaxID=44008 RepID=UPI000E130111|nr:hypothetical protein EB06_01201 [Enterococcus cecorum]